MSATKRQLTPIPFTRVHFDDAFWSPRIETNRKVTLPHIHRMLEETGRIGAFDLNFEREVPSRITLIFGDSDPAKWGAAASYSLATHPDPQLEALVDAVVEKIVGAQQPDGYLNTHFIHVQPDMRWKNLRDWHELYCAGHLIEGAVAHFQATGQRKLLDALCRYVDHIDQTFGPGPDQKPGYPGHPEIELALVRLYHATGNERYLQLSKFFVDERGQQSETKPHYYDVEAFARGDDPKKFWARTYEYNQSHKPVREQEKVVGHAVRAMYLYSAMADLADETEDASLIEASERLWENLTNRRMYITGGTGPSRHNEGFTTDYDLLDETAYAETCATIALVMWNARMLQFEGASRFADVMERGLYNGFLSGVSLAGNTFYYENPLSSSGDHHHVPWFDCPCCPPNVARVLASLGQYFYSTSADGIWVHLFAGGSADLDVGGRAVRVQQETNYPWDGALRLVVEPQQPQTFTLHLRLPGWCKGFRLKVNGVEQSIQPSAGGYLAIAREWRSGDTVDYVMEMPVEAVWANPAVRQLAGRVAIQRGPIVYTLEGVDHGGMLLDRIAVDPAAIGQWAVEYRPDLLGGVNVIRGQGMALAADGWGETLYRSGPAPEQTPGEITAVPYCVWDNREAGEMRVWLRAR